MDYAEIFQVIKSNQFTNLRKHNEQQSNIATTKDQLELTLFSLLSVLNEAVSLNTVYCYENNSHFISGAIVIC